MPPDVPLVISEYGYSAFPGRAEVGLEAALLNADIVGRFLMLGGRAAFLYGWEPTSLDKSSRCATWGNNMLFLADQHRRIVARTAAYHGARLLTQQWVAAGGGEHIMYAAESSARDDDGNELLSAYVVHRPDGQWATLLVNKDPRRAYRVSLDFGRQWGGRASGARVVASYSAAQYAWREHGVRGRPVRSMPPAVRTLRGGAPLDVPPYSLTVIRETRP